MADRVTIRTLFAIAASRNMGIEYFDISGAYLHEAYKHDKKVFVWQPQRFNGSYKHPATHGNSKAMCTAHPLRRLGQPPQTSTAKHCTSTPKHMRTRNCAQIRLSSRKQTHTDSRHQQGRCFYQSSPDKALIDSLYHTLEKTVKRIRRPTAYLNWEIGYVPKGVHISQPDHIDSVVTLLAQTGCNR